MHLPGRRSLGILFGLIRALFAQTYTSCDPTNVTCPPTPGLDSGYYYIDFTQVKSLPLDWSVPVWCNVTYNTNGRQNGAELEFLERYDSPQLYSNFYFLFGRAEFVIQAAPGPGIISDMMLLSDDLDELDWEFRGTLNTEVQTGWFGKGVTGLYNHSITPQVPTPMTDFHTYAYDWTSERVNWEVDGVIIRTLQASDCIGTANQYPQTPMKAMVGLWDAGDPDHYDPWSAGMTPIPPPAGDYSFYVKSVKIWNSYPAMCYNWTNRSGDWQSIQVLNDASSCATNPSSSSAVISSKSTSASSPASLSYASSLSATSSSVPSPSVDSIPSRAPTSEPSSSTSSLSKSSPTASTSGTYESQTSPSLGLSQVSTWGTSPSSAITSNQISPKQPVEHMTASSSAIAISAQSQASILRSGATGSTVISILSSALRSTASVLTMSGSSKTRAAVISNVAGSMASDPSLVLTRTPSSSASRTSLGSFDASSLSSSAKTSEPIRMSALPTSTLPTRRHTRPAVFPGHHTLPYNPVVDHLTELVDSLDSMIHKGGLERTKTTSVLTSAFAQSSSGNAVGSLSSVTLGLHSMSALASSPHSVNSILGATTDYPDMSMSSECSTTTSSNGGTNFAPTASFPSLSLGFIVAGGSLLQQLKSDESLNTSRVASNGTASGTVFAFNTSSTLTSSDSQVPTSKQNSSQQQDASLSSLSVSTPTQTGYDLAAARATNLHTFTVTSTHSGNTSSSIRNTYNNQTSARSINATSAAFLEPLGVNSSSGTTLVPTNPWPRVSASNSLSISAGHQSNSGATPASQTSSHAINSHSHQHDHLHDQLHGHSPRANLTNSANSTQPSLTTGKATATLQAESGANTTTVANQRSPSFMSATSAAASPTDFSSDAQSGVPILPTSLSGNFSNATVGNPSSNASTPLVFHHQSRAWRLLSLDTLYVVFLTVLFFLTSSGM